MIAWWEVRHAVASACVFLILFFTALAILSLILGIAYVVSTINLGLEYDTTAVIYGSILLSAIILVLHTIRKVRI